MREKLNTLPLSELKELAKAQKLKGFSSLRKAELIDLLCQSAEQLQKTVLKLSLCRQQKISLTKKIRSGKVWNRKNPSRQK